MRKCPPAFQQTAGAFAIFCNFIDKFPDFLYNEAILRKGGSPMPETNNYTPPTPPNDPPGKSNATASLVLGIIAVVLWFFGYSAIISVILGIVGLIQASRAKELGYEDTTRTAGFILSLIGLIGGALACVACVACVGLFASTGIAAGGLYAS